MSGRVGPDGWQEIAAELQTLREMPPPPRMAGRAVDRWLEQRQSARGAWCARPWWRVAVGMAGATMLAAVWVGRPPVPGEPRRLKPRATDGTFSRPAPTVGAALVAAPGDHKGRPYGAFASPRFQPPGPPPGPPPVSPVLRPALRAPIASPPSDDLTHINAPPEVAFRRWARVTEQEMSVMAAAIRPAMAAGDSFVSVPLPRIAAAGEAGDRAVVEAVAAYRRETAVVDARLQRRLTLAAKGTALADLCEQMGAESGVRLAAARSVGDEKVTLLCRDAPLRDLMRQLGRPFGYTWLRSGKEGEYRYELAQDLRSQLLEEELRNRDRNAALIDLDAEMQQYRRYLSLSPDEALARSKTAPPSEKPILEKLGGHTWGAIQLYFKLSPADIAALRTGQTLIYTSRPEPGEQPLPPEIASGVLMSCRDTRVISENGKLRPVSVKEAPDGPRLVDVPEARAAVTLRLDHSEMGQFRLDGGGGFRLSGHNSTWDTGLATGISPGVRRPENAKANAKWASEPALKPRVTLEPKHACAFGGHGRGDQRPRTNDQRTTAEESRVTSADALEALHRATGLPIVADYYMRFHTPGELTVRNASVYDALNRVSDAARLRWSWDGGTSSSAGKGTTPSGWLQLRSANFFNDRLKEVPNRLLAGWSASRQRHGMLTIEDLVAIGQLTDPQLDSRDVAEGSLRCFGLAEWNLARNIYGLRPTLRYLSTLSPLQRDRARSPGGLAFTALTLAQQQGFLSLALPGFSERASFDLSEMAGSTLRLDYTLPGAFEWRPIAGKEEPSWKQLVPTPVRETSRAAALAAALRADPSATDEAVKATELALTLFTSWGDPNTRHAVFAVRGTPRGTRVIAHTKVGNDSHTSDGTRSE